MISSTISMSHPSTILKTRMPETVTIFSDIIDLT
jgi:hypothetical protein